MAAIEAVTFSYGQNSPENACLKVLETSVPVRIDGELQDEIWSEAPRAAGFYQTFPTDSIAALDSSYFQISYDAEFIYVAAFCHDSNPEQDIVAQSLRRDFSWSQNDNFSIYFDPFNDGTNGYAFQVTPLNVRREGLVTFGGSVADDWDNVWYSATSAVANGWIVEMAIPFNSIRYNSTDTWRVQALRNNLKLNERSSWIQVPIQYRPSDLLYTGTVQWDRPPPPQGTNISFIPYAAANINRDFEENGNYLTDPGIGFDAKVGIGNALNLDLTFNPDFSQVEVDRQVTNLNRFEIFFPERRQFFLENQDLFAQGGFRSTRPFFSRRIGIARNEDGLARQIPILGGARLSGKIGRDWRVGALMMQTAADRETNQPLQNYSVATFQRQIFARSNIGAIVVNRQAINYDQSDSTLNTTAYNRVAGFDYNLLSASNRWEGDMYYHHSFDPERKKDAFSTGLFLSYRVREFRIFYSHRLVGDGFNADVGFVPRTGIFDVGFGGSYNFYPANSPVQRHGPSVRFSRLSNTDLDRLDEDYNLSYEVDFLNTADLEIGTTYSSVLLLRGFDPTNTEGAELEADQRFDWRNVYLEYRSDRRKVFNYSTEVSYGGFFNGRRLRLNGNINYRYQPYLQVGISSEYNQLRFPEPYNSADFFLIGPRFDVTLTTKLFITSFVQYNNQIENLNINTRIQWRFAPVSDLFIVYTDNFDTMNFREKNRALVVKLSYWFNL